MHYQLRHCETLIRQLQRTLSEAETILIRDGWASHEELDRARQALLTLEDIVDQILARNDEYE